MTQIRPVIFGEVLFDCYPDGTEVLGGAPFNVAWHLQGFGLLPVFISRIGEDRRGGMVVQAMSKWGMDTTFLQHDPDRPTGTVKVRLNNGEPTYKISPDDAYDHIKDEISGLPADAPVLYHGSLALRSQQSLDTLKKIKQQVNGDIFIDINLRHPWWERDFALSLMEDASWVKMNKEEIEILFPLHKSIDQKAKDIIEYFNLKILILTKGSKGSTVYLKEGDKLSLLPSPPIMVVDTVGAGDAFSAVFILGLIMGWPTQKIIHNAQEFASAIIGKRGAIVSDRRFYTTFLSRFVINKVGVK